MFRMGLLAALRSRSKESSAIGLMITASHNAEPDNGVKLIDPMGEMLDQRWESIATELVNVPNSALQEQLDKIVMFSGANVTSPALVFVGRDTRPSGPHLSEASITGVEAYSGKVVDFGIVSTPMLHYFVALHNSTQSENEPQPDHLRTAYFNKLSLSFIDLQKGQTTSGNYSAELDFDGANGVGAIIMKEFSKHIGSKLKVNVYNDSTDVRGKLNYMCGADYVKTNQKAPEGLPRIPNRRCVSVDGDADRIVYFYTDADGKFHLLDGDRIATLVASYLMDLVRESGLSIELGLVQTAYANGNSTRYIAEMLKIPVACVSTGVKHLHHRALDYDIGVYFEANGHGTIVFSSKAKQIIAKAVKDEKAAMRLERVVDVINETVGDALSDMFLVESILAARGWNLSDWEAAYTDLPSRMLKVVVKDRNLVQTTDAERKCTAPAGLQRAIDELVKETPYGRAFVRPSGTEDIVRVYAEASTQEAADLLATKVAQAVFDLSGGVGTKPN
ncbi:hypothetical protein AAG570_009293 [Ranatra chinensis]|uniref:Phosphoacetylglucosamine mutase n=1 Tax=Ranatra chinensis TaxID=642074 RepID=A0ABD0YNR1_9HEMI